MLLIVCCQMRIRPLKSISLILINVSLLLAKISVNSLPWLLVMAQPAHFFRRGSGICASELKIYRTIKSLWQDGGLKKQKNGFKVMGLTVWMIEKN